MSSRWRPDDSFLEMEDGELRGVRRVMKALKENGVAARRGVLTSLDEGVEGARKALRRKNMPDGLQAWQEPVVLGPDKNVLAFRTEFEPGAVVPEHSHRVELFRMIISGSVFHGDQELGPGHWMSIEADAPYELRAGSDGCVIFHMYW